MKKEIAIHRSFSYFIKNTLLILCVLLLPLTFIGSSIEVIFGRGDWSGVGLLSIGLALLALFGSLSLFFFKMLFTLKPVLIIDERGITDQKSLFNFGLIPWNEITGVNGYKLNRENSIGGVIKFTTEFEFLHIDIENPERLLTNYKGIKRQLLKSRIHNKQPVISLSTKTLKIDDYSEVESFINTHLEKTMKFKEEKEKGDFFSIL